MSGLPREWDYVVIGAGVAGLNAVKAIIHANPLASILCVDRHEEPGGKLSHVHPSAETIHSFALHSHAESNRLLERLNPSPLLNPDTLLAPEEPTIIP